VLERGRAGDGAVGVRLRGRGHLCEIDERALEIEAAGAVEIGANAAYAGVRRPVERHMEVQG